MKVIGLCGGSGAGKGLVCSFFNDLGIKSIDTDKVYHDLISTDSECTRELVLRFGKQISNDAGINRLKLRDVVFASKENLAILNKITHRHILAKVRDLLNEIKASGAARGVIIDAPLLFESGFDKECDLTICVIADKYARIERIVRRDGISAEAAFARIDTQISDDELIKKCTYVIYNDSTEDHLREKVRELNKIIFDNQK